MSGSIPIDRSRNRTLGNGLEHPEELRPMDSAALLACEHKFARIAPFTKPGAQNFSFNRRAQIRCWYSGQQVNFFKNTEHRGLLCGSIHLTESIHVPLVCSRKGPKFRPPCRPHVDVHDLQD